MNKIIQLKENLKKVIKGKDHIIDLVIIALFSDGNILLNDVPGVGKTTLAKALAFSIQGQFQRVQFTPDLLPSDITGSSIFNPKDAEFHFRPGPLFANIFLADEINRASPRTQSALLEAMNEDQVSIEGVTYPLPSPFMVIATENPVEYQGTYPLPEAQLDRFIMQLEIGYPKEEDELEILYSRQDHDPLNDIDNIISCDDIAEIQEEVKHVKVEKSVAHYILKIIRATRESTDIKLGASPRAFLALTRATQAKAFIDGRDYVIPDDVKTLAPAVIAHRIILENKIKYSGEDKLNVFNKILSKIDIPI